LTIDLDFLQRKARFVIRVARNARVGKKRARCRAREGMCGCGVDSRWWVCGFGVGTRTKVRAESGDRARRVAANKAFISKIFLPAASAKSCGITYQKDDCETVRM
jgi:hypothetical protein